MFQEEKYKTRRPNRARPGIRRECQVLTRQGLRTMSQSHTDPGENNQDELERLLMQGIEAPPVSAQSGVDDRDNRASRLHYDQNTIVPPASEDEEENMEVSTSGDIQDAVGLLAEAEQDMATAGVVFSLGRHFAYVDFWSTEVEQP